MKIQMNLNGGKRKDLAAAVGELLGAEAVYQRPPSYAYQIGGVVLDRGGKLVLGEDMNAEAVQQLLEGLKAKGFSAAELPDKLVVQMPLDGFDEAKLENLQKIIASKATLIQKALGVDALTVEQIGEAICFPWFALDTPAEDVAVYTQFISALCEMAKKQTRVLAVEKPVVNEKYQFRCFLLRLGFIGEDYAPARRILLRNLSGNGSLRSGERKPKPEVVETDGEATPVENATEAAPPSKGKFSFSKLLGALKTLALD